MNLIKSEISKGTQSLSLTEVRENQGMKVQVKIKSDSYDFQSSAIVYVWHKDNLQWNVIGSIPYSNMKTESALYARVNSSQSLEIYRKSFEEDKNNLLKLASEVLDISFVDVPKVIAKKVKAK